MTISLRDVRLFAYHGLHPEERILGNWFVLQIDLTVRSGAAIINSIDQTVNYAEVFSLVKQIFGQPQDLLETLCGQIASALMEKFPLITAGTISIEKVNPPIGQFQGRVIVTHQFNSSV